MEVLKLAYRGTDISSYQGNIDITALSSQVDFFVFRAYGGITEDSKVNRNVALAIQNEKPYGLYIYSYALNVLQAKEEAQRLIKLADSFIVKPTFLAFDMEDSDGYKEKHGMPSDQILKDMCSVACEEFEKAGYYAMIYANLYWFNTKLKGLNRFDKWLARWPVLGGKQTANNTSPDGESATTCGIWQYTSQGRLNGYTRKFRFKLWL